MALTDMVQRARAIVARVYADERYHYKSATIHENAPLALIQLELEARMAAASEILGEPVMKPKRAAIERARGEA